MSFFFPLLFKSCGFISYVFDKLDRYADLHARKIIHNGGKPENIRLSSLSSSATDAPTLNLLNFGYSFFCASSRLVRDEECLRNSEFTSILSNHGFSKFFIIRSQYKCPYNNIIAQSQRDDLESLSYLLSALFQGSPPWDTNSWEHEPLRKKMSTPGSVLFRDMDPSFLEYWKDVRSLAFNEVPDYCSLKSRFVQCWERKGFGGSPGEYDWLALWNRLSGAKGNTPVVHSKRTSCAALCFVFLIIPCTSKFMFCHS